MNLKEFKDELKKKARSGHPLKEIAIDMKNNGLKVAIPDGGWINWFDFERALEDLEASFQKDDKVEVEITHAKCEICGTRVEPQIGFGQTWIGKDDKRLFDNRLHTYWSCPNHGAVGAKIGNNYFHKPEDALGSVMLMDIQKIKFLGNMPPSPDGLGHVVCPKTHNKEKD